MTALAEAECEVALLRPCGDRIICRFVEPEDMTPGGIVLAPGAAAKPMFAEVIAVGPGRIAAVESWKPLPQGAALGDPLARKKKDAERPPVNVLRAPMSCKPGDKICLNQYAGVQIELGDEKIQIIRDEDVMAVIADCDSGDPSSTAASDEATYGQQ